MAPARTRATNSPRGRAVPAAEAAGRSTHAKGQVLYVTDGVGLVSTRDSDVVRITASETVKCPADEGHWHGATDTPLMAHIAMVVGDESGDGTTWLEPVTDEQFTAALDATGR
ncbi:cupin domain-containing protein [Streptomyces sp. NPDC050844]|uniref:cupin domain-containing protein n=1 Tax=Streptomyces sp. NPDC050844 TaxID=3155790 RepID=UPI0033DFAFBB